MVYNIILFIYSIKIVVAQLGSLLLLFFSPENFKALLQIGIFFYIVQDH